MKSIFVLALLYKGRLAKDAVIRIEGREIAFKQNSSVEFTEEGELRDANPGPQG